MLPTTTIAHNSKLMQLAALLIAAAARPAVGGFINPNYYALERMQRLSEITREREMGRMPRLGKDLIVSVGGECIDFQADESKFGRGEFHLSATLDEGDVVVWQSGTWTVDGVEVGDGTPPKLHYARIDNIQLVWTHNCEHGVIRGTKVILSNNSVDDTKTRFFVSVPLDEVEFGPEQLIARLPVVWDEIKDEGVSSLRLDESMWKSPGTS